MAFGMLLLDMLRADGSIHHEDLYKQMQDTAQLDEAGGLPKRVDILRGCNLLQLCPWSPEHAELML